MKKYKLGIISGYFNPPHLGHLDYINGSKNMCDVLVVIVNNDFQVALKGSKPFMSENHRKEIVSNFRSVDFVVISIDEDRTVCKTIRKIKEDIKSSGVSVAFFNSGDRIGDNIDSAEKHLCQELGIDFVLLPMEKRYSSSELIKNYYE